jgi:hypothetical protein
VNPARVSANLLAPLQTADFPMIGKKLSNGWKTPPDFSNDWKNFSPVFQRLEKIFRPGSGNKKDKKDNKTSGGQNRSDNSDNSDNCFGDNLEKRNSDPSDGSANAPPAWAGKMSKCGPWRMPRRGFRRGPRWIALGKTMGKLCRSVSAGIGQIGVFFLNPSAVYITGTSR